MVCLLVSAERIQAPHGRPSWHCLVVESAVDVTKGREILPTNVKPLHYRLTLEPNLETFEYYGTVEIEYDMHRAMGNDM